MINVLVYSSGLVDVNVGPNYNSTAYPRGCSLISKFALVVTFNLHPPTSMPALGGLSVVELKYVSTLDLLTSFGIVYTGLCELSVSALGKFSGSSTVNNEGSVTPEPLQPV